MRRRLRLSDYWPVGFFCLLVLPGCQRGSEGVQQTAGAGSTQIATVKGNVTIHAVPGQEQAVLEQRRVHRLSLLTEASRLRSRGDLGHVEALGELILEKRSFDGYDFAGMGLRNLQGQGMHAPSADFSLALLTSSSMGNANLEKASLIGTSIDKADLSQAKLAAARAAFANAKGAKLRGADLSLGNWFAADLREADLSSANLRGVSFAHADLRGADLRGSDLTGAFLGNADLRDAKLERAVFGNTDVSSALLPATLLDLEQARSICGSPLGVQGGGGQQWMVMELVPNGRYSGGIGVDRLYEMWLYINPVGHRPYPLCAPRADGTITSWNTPVFANAWNSSFGIQFRQSVLEGPGVRQELLQRVRAAFNAALQRRSELAALPQFAQEASQLAKRAEQRLQILVGQPAPTEPLFLDGDTALVLTLRLRSQLITAPDFDWQKASVAGLKSTLGSANSRDSPRPWPRLFPDEMVASDLGPWAGSVFERWTRWRSRALSSNKVAIRLSSSGLTDRRAGWDKVIVFSNHSPKADPALASTLNVEPSRIGAFRPSAGTPEAASNIGIAFVLTESAQDYRGRTLVSQSKGSAHAVATVTDVRLVDVGVTKYFVWHLQMD